MPRSYWTDRYNASVSSRTAQCCRADEGAATCPTRAAQNRSSSATSSTFGCPRDSRKEQRDDLTQPFELVFDEGLKAGMIDRPVEIVFREVEGLPKGSAKAVIDAYGELVDEGCLAVFGPAITDNAVPTREAIEERFHVPAISVTGTEDWLGEWTFALPQGSLTDEPIFWAHLLAKRGYTEVGALIEQSLIGDSYIRNFRKACAAQGIRVVAEEWIAQTAQDVAEAVGKVLRRATGRDRALRFRFRSGQHQPGARRHSGGTRPASWGPRSRTRGSTR